MAFATTALAVIAGIYVYNEFIKADDSVAAPAADPASGAAAGTGFAGRRRMRR